MTDILPIHPPSVTPKDMTVLAKSLDVPTTSLHAFESLFTDQECLDVILNCPQVYDSLVNKGAIAELSAELAFCIAARHCLRKVGLDDVELAQFLASTLTTYATAPQVEDADDTAPLETSYLIELLRAVKRSPSDSRFLIRTHIGIYALYVTGVFPERIPYRSASRTTPDFAYFCDLGSTTFRAVAEDRLAWEFGLDDICAKLARHFRQVRMALSNMSQLDLPFGKPTINHSAMLAVVV